MDRVHECAQRWWSAVRQTTDPSRSSPFDFGPVARFNRIISCGSIPGELMGCSDVQIYVDAKAFGLNRSRQILAESLRLLHAASRDPVVFHSIWEITAGCPTKLGPCEFCDGCHGIVMVRVLLEAGDQQDVPRVIREALFEWNEFGATKEYVDLQLAIRDAVTHWHHPKLLRLELDLGRSLSESACDAFLREVQMLVTQNKMAAPTTNFFEFSLFRCVAESVTAPWEEYMAIVHAMACSGVPMQINGPIASLFGGGGKKEREWVEEVIKLLSDPVANVVALSLPESSPWPADILERLTNTLHRCSTLKHLALNWRLSIHQEERKRERLAIGKLFSSDSELQLKSLTLALGSVRDEDADMFVSTATRQLTCFVQRVVWNTENSSPGFARQFAQFLNYLGVEAVTANNGGGFQDLPSNLVLPVLQSCTCLINFTAFGVVVSPDFGDVCTHCAWSQNLQSLEVHIRTRDRDIVENFLEYLLTHTGSKLASLKLLFQNHTSFGSRVAQLLSLHAPSLKVLSVQGFDAAFLTALVDEFDAGRCTVFTLELSRVAGAESVVEPLIDMLGDPSRPGSQYIRCLILSATMRMDGTSEDLCDKVIVLLTRNQVLRTVKMSGRWTLGAASKLLKLPQTYRIEPPSAARRLALLGVLRRIASPAIIQIPTEATQLIFTFGGRLESRVLISVAST